MVILIDSLLVAVCSQSAEVVGVNRKVVKGHGTQVVWIKPWIMDIESL